MSLVEQALTALMRLFNGRDQSLDQVKDEETASLYLSLGAYRFGFPQSTGAMTMVPIYGNDQNGKYVYPRSGLKLSQVRGYGNLELTNPSEKGIAIVPLHMGYIQDKAQNHAICRSAFIAAGQKLMFEDACCVQAAQGGYLEEREQWFFILPLALREDALSLKGKKDYSKLWPAISALNSKFGLDDRGHLELILSKQRNYLTQYQSRLELTPNQIGALFFINDKLVGLEIAPSAGYFQELWMPLVCFSYGVNAMYAEQISKDQFNPYQIKFNQPAPLPANSLSELRTQLNLRREQRQQQLRDKLMQLPSETFTFNEEERFLSLVLKTVAGNNFTGQIVEDDNKLIYASIFARSKYLNN